MGGCELPVIINSGSGNQGITVSIPVVEYARELGADEDTMLRALIISNLVAIHVKSGMGALSAYCGAVSAAAGAGAGIAYLYGGGLYEISHTIVNCLAITSGIVCDGAKPSCAGKIAAALDSALLGRHMIMNNQQFRGGDGILKKGVEQTISTVSRLSKDGMKQTDREILDIMIL
jgi:L-cysteine desulfidase